MLGKCRGSHAWSNRENVTDRCPMIGASLDDDYGDSDKKELVSQKIAFVGAWHLGRHLDLGQPICNAERKHGNINIRVNRIILCAPPTKVGDR